MRPFTGDITNTTGDMDIGAGDRDVLGDMLEITLGDIGFDFLTGVLGGNRSASTGVAGNKNI